MVVVFPEPLTPIAATIKTVPVPPLEMFKAAANNKLCLQPFFASAYFSSDRLFRFLFSGLQQN